MKIVFQVNLVQTAKVVNQEHQDEAVHEVPKENQDHRDPKDQLDRKDFQVQMEMMEIKASSGHLDHLDHQVNQDQMVHQVSVVQWVHREHQELMHPIVHVHHDVLPLRDPRDNLLYSYCFTNVTIGVDEIYLSANFLIFLHH